MTEPAGSTPNGITRRALTTAAAWSVPVVGLALAAPHAAATTPPVMGLTLTAYPAFPGEDLYIVGEFAPGFGEIPGPYTWFTTGAATGSGSDAYNGLGLIEFSVIAGPTPGMAVVAVTFGGETSYVSVEVLDPTLLRIVNDGPVAPHYPGQNFASLNAALYRGTVLEGGDVVFTVRSGDVSIPSPSVTTANGIINFTGVVAGATYNSTAVVRATVVESGLYTEWTLTIFPEPTEPVATKVTTNLAPVPVNGGWGSVSVNVKGGVWRDYYTLHYEVTGPAVLSMSNDVASGSNTINNVVIAHYPGGGSDNLPYLLALGTPGDVTVTAQVVGYPSTLLTWSTSVYEP